MTRGRLAYNAKEQRIVAEYSQPTAPIKKLNDVADVTKGVANLLLVY